MKIIGVHSLAIPDIKVMRFARFCDQRGYFTEHFRKSDFQASELREVLNGDAFVQTNESFSRASTIRGLHFQWNPYMGKLVRTVQGHMVDLILDIRRGSETFGKIIAYDMPSHVSDDFNEWIWVPPGFAHGNMFLEDTSIEYFCTGEYSQGCEAAISPLSPDIDWSMCDPGLAASFSGMSRETKLITEKDRNGLTVAAWRDDPRSNNFIYDESSAHKVRGGA